MRRYRDAGRNSGVEAFECGPTFIAVKFHRGGTFRYTYKTAGSHHIEQMKALAAAGKGLNTYINQHTRELFER